MKRWLMWSAVALGVVLLGSFGAGLWLLQGSLPGAPAEHPVRGVGAAVEIRYDSRRRPYVDARGLEDALFAQGWLHARDRLWQMELLRRAGGGRLAEGLGRGMLETDRSLWTVGVPQLAERLARNASAALNARIAAYVAGVNAGIDTLDRLPPEFLLAGLGRPRWNAMDVFAIGALLAHQSANNQNNERLRLVLAGLLDADRFQAFLPDETELVDDFPDVLREPLTASQAVALLEGAEALASLDASLFPGIALGSSGWVVAPGRSASGRALFAFDSHDDLSLPNLFYEVHLFFGARQIRGWSVPGLPGVINGYNHRVAWGLTNIGDTQDLFIEEAHPDDPDLLRGPDGWYRVRVERIEIPVAGGGPPDELRVRHSRHGPLVSDDPPLALKWTGHRVGELGMDAFLAMNLAEDWPAFAAALDRLLAPTTNVTYADVDGTIAFRTAGLLPRRSRGQGLLPQPGAAPDAGWRGYVPAADMPEAVNPPAGFLAAANARVAAHGPLVSADNAPGYRAQRLHAVLSSTARVSPQDMARLQVDWHNTQAERLLPVLLETLAAAGFEGRLARAARLLRDWQAKPVNAPGLAAPVVYEHFYLALAEEVFAAVLPAEVFERLAANNYVLNHALDRIVTDPASPWWDGQHEARVAQAFRRAVAVATARLEVEPEQWRWDDVQTIALHHELAGEIPLAGHWLNRQRPWGGGPATLGRARYRYHRPFLARAGATVRVVAEMSSPIVARAVIPGGQSGHPLSRHYDDQLELWLSGELERLPAFPADVGPGADVLVPQ